MKKILIFLFTIITIAGYSQSVTITIGGISGASVANSDSLDNKAPAFYVDTLNNQNLFGAKVFKDDLVLDSTLSIGVYSPNATAILDITSTTKGLLQPRMTATQRDAISTPAEGLGVYDLSNNVPNFHDGTEWRRFSHTREASPLQQGGIVVTELANNSSLITDSVNFFWDNSGKKLGIKTSSPNAELAVIGAIVSNTYNFAIDAELGDSYQIAIPDLVALTIGLKVTFKVSTANSGAATLEITSIGDIDAILKKHDQALVTGDVEGGQILVCVWDGSNWQMVSQLAQ